MVFSPFHLRFTSFSISVSITQHSEEDVAIYMFANPYSTISCSPQIHWKLERKGKLKTLGKLEEVERKRNFIAFLFICLLKFSPRLVHNSQSEESGTDGENEK